MSLNSFPWSGTSPGSAGPYSAAQFAAFIAGLFNKGGDKPDQSIAVGSGSTAPPAALGLLQGFGLDVYQNAVANMSVNVGTGAAIVNGTWCNNPTNPINLVINANVSGNPRIDTVVIHLDINAQTAVVQVNQGTPAGSPLPPGLTQSALIWEVPLADVAVANAASSISQANLTPRQIPANAADGTYLLVKNNSGVVLTTGQVVVWDQSQQQAVKITTFANDSSVAGVVVGRIPAGSIGMICVRGVCWVNVNAAISNGQMLTTAATGGQAQPQNLFFNQWAFGYAMSALAGAGLMPAYVDCTYVTLNNIGFLWNYASGNQGAASGNVKFNNGANYTTTSVTFVDVDATNLVLTFTPHTTKAIVLVQVPVVQNATGNTFLDIAIKIGAGAYNRWGGTNGLASAVNPSTGATIAVIVTGLTANTATSIKLQWRVSAGTATMLANGDFVSISAAASLQ